MVLAMTRPWRHPKSGIYWVRRRIPVDLRPLLGGKTEELRSLATKDVEEAKRRFGRALVEIDAKWAELRGGPKSLTEREAHNLAATIYGNWLEFHRDEPSNQLIWQTDLYRRLWIASASQEVRRDGVGIDELSLQAMRRFCFQQADLGLSLHGLLVDPDSRTKLARAVGAALQRASLTLEREGQGVYDDELPSRVPPQTLGGERRSRLPVNSGSTNSSGTSTITGLLDDWWREAKAAGRKPSTYESYRNTVTGFVAFLKHDDARRLTAEDVIAFKDHRLATPSPRTGRVPSAKTVKDSDLSALKTIFGWALINRRLSANHAAGITIKVSKPQRLRSKGFSDQEAEAILRATLDREASGENPGTAAAKRWVPWLAAYTGARVGELAQLRRQDISREGEYAVLRITPEAGTVKTNEARSVVIHPCVIEQGFWVFVEESKEGHLFLTPAKNGDVLGPLQGLKNRLAEFSRSIVPDPQVAPNHGWRHRFKTIGMEVGIPPRILDAIQGQAAKSVGDTYGDVTLKTIATAIYKLPEIDLDPKKPFESRSLRQTHWLTN